MGFRTSWKRTIVLLAATLALVAGLTACGSAETGSDTDSPDGNDVSVSDATLVLDYLPGAVHAGIYEALDRGYYEQNGINLKVIEPPSTSDALKLVEAGKAEFGIADGIDLATQISAGRNVQGILALAQRPPGGLITLEREGITDPKQLEGETVGVTGVPSDAAVLDTIIGDTGGNPDDVETVTLGFNGVQALEAGKVKAFTGFIPADAVQIEADGLSTRSFPLDEYGGPSYPGLVVFSTESKIGQDPDLMQGFVDATTRGYREAIADPAAAIDSLLSQTQGLEKKLARKSFDAWRPLFGPPATFGQFNRQNLESLSAFMVENELAGEPISPDRYATTVFTRPREETGK